MIRLILYLVLVILAALAAAWFADNPGRIAIDWLGYRAETSMAALAFLLFALFFTGMALQRLFTLITRDLPFSKEKRRKRRLEKGYDALNDAMVALSAGDRKAARHLTDRAARMLPAQPLTHVMAAEAARLMDDHETAKAHYKALTQDDRAAFLGLRGLIGEARADGDEEEARALAAKAVELRPKSQWTLQTLFDHDIKATEWERALATLSRMLKAGTVDKARYAADRAALLYARAVEADLAGQADIARKLAEEAAKTNPALIPAIALAARLFIAGGKSKHAEKLLQTGWKAAPHPMLLDMWHALAPNETSTARLNRIKRLITLNPDHPESHLALAAAALEAEDTALARKATESALANGDRRAFLLRAALAEKDGNGDLAQSWRDKAASHAGPYAAIAAHVASWQCSHCKSTRPRWSPICPSCGAFNSLSWNAGPTDQQAMLQSQPRPVGLLGQTPDPRIPRDAVPEEPFHS